MEHVEAKQSLLHGTHTYSTARTCTRAPAHTNDRTCMHATAFACALARARRHTKPPCSARQPACERSAVHLRAHPLLRSHTHERSHAQTRAHEQVESQAHTRTHTNAHTRSRKRTHADAHTRRHTRTHAHEQTHTRTRARTYPPAHAHEHTHARAFLTYFSHAGTYACSHTNKNAITNERSLTDERARVRARVSRLHANLHARARGRASSLTHTTAAQEGARRWSGG
jgi:hypothetical protein